MKMEVDKTKKRKEAKNEDGGEVSLSTLKNPSSSKTRGKEKKKKNLEYT